MSTSPATRASLLLRIRDPKDRIAWGEFVRIYAPLLHAYGMHRGLQDADAGDLAQEVLWRIMQAVPEFQYDPSRGSFRGWLFTITRNELLKMLAKRGRQPAGTGDSDMKQVLEQHPDDPQDEEHWNREYQWNLFQWAAKRVQAEFKETTWQAFWLTAVQGKEVEAVAKELGDRTIFAATDVTNADEVSGAVQAAVLEPLRSGTDGVGRSWTLTKGFKGRALVLYFVVFVLFFLFAVGAGLVTAVAAAGAVAFVGDRIEDRIEREEWIPRKVHLRDQPRLKRRSEQ